MPCHISDTKIDPREVYEDTPTAAESDEYNGGYEDFEQFAFYNGDPDSAHTSYVNGCQCPMCCARTAAAYKGE